MQGNLLVWNFRFGQWDLKSPESSTGPTCDRAGRITGTERSTAMIIDLTVTVIAVIALTATVTIRITRIRRRK